ncbi:Stp1/IreP family PP2C-type Ser/Thr phosphatase [Roseateles sp. BYS180W]|uniref:Stp1/IreP family PP2C-type Ser/Thr phosphatase n=1 Tax=Roseateles rivi TaxID=3299028 RepID=A0ABW7FT59_9BURK
MNLEFFSATDTGRVRDNNEDSVALDEQAGLFILADGMGGYNAGEVASQMLTGFLKAELGRWLRETEGQAAESEVCRAMEICVDNANRAIFNAATSNPRYAGMGTTLVFGVFAGSRLVLGHVGDSRAYLWREGALRQLTRDHSLLQEQLDAGLLTPSQAAVSLNRNLVTRAVGVDEHLMLELTPQDAKSGDIYLLCSDGLTDMLDETTLAQLFQAHGQLPELGRALIDAANDYGGRDNIAVILVRTSENTRHRRWWAPGRA